MEDGYDYGYDDKYDYRVTDYIMEDAFQARKRKIDAEHKAAIKRVREEKVYVLYIEFPAEGGFVEEYSSYDLARNEAIKTHEHYRNAYIEVSCRGTKLLVYPGNSNAS